MGLLKIRIGSYARYADVSVKLQPLIMECDAPRLRALFAMGWVSVDV